MQAGTLTLVIEIEAATYGKDSEGEHTQTFTNLFPGKPIKAELKGLASEEVANDKQNQVVKTYRLTLRHPKPSEPQVTEQHRVKFGGKTYGIVSAENVEMKFKTLVLTVKEIKTT